MEVSGKRGERKRGVDSEIRGRRADDELLLLLWNSKGGDVIYIKN